MPVNHQKSDSSSEMDSDLTPSCRLSDLSRGGSLESRSSSSRSRSLTLDDESLKYLTHEEKDVILFFEETIDSLEDDFEEQVLCDSGVHCHSPQSLEGSTSSPSEPEDVIDLVQPVPAAGEPERLPGVSEAAGAGPVGKEDIPALELGTQGREISPQPESTVPEAPPQPPSLPVPTAPAHPRKEPLSASPPAEHPKLPRSVPTPLVIAQKISEKLAGSEALSPTSPSKEGRPGEWWTLTSTAPRIGDHSLWHRHTTEQTPPLANGFQSIHDVLKGEPGGFFSTGKTVTFHPDPALTSKLARQNASKSLYEHQPPDCSQDARKRSGSLPRAVGFRPQGITVQFAGRGSTEEARREALRKLGLLKENL
ncbi:proline and serine rich 2 [Phyllostomus discolor]|uniref:Proline and serine rich 2 n=1 Tax=Phyllostomus discolor TaxID=89673 RepID=A0A834BKB9_9CHIR|nr:proline and serine rich 2 [Phyllostomus discolor]